MALTGPDLPKIPDPLKQIQPYLTIGKKHDSRDSVVSYWCRLYALQTGLKLSTKTAEETNFLLKLMDWLEATKKALHDNEAITNDVAAQAHLENWALKLFLFADKNDRESNFSQKVVHSFFTAQVLYDVLTLFGELSVEATQNRKYAQWKAAYIHNCLTNGETPVPGPMKENDDNVTDNQENDITTETLNTDQDSESNINPEDIKKNTPPSIPSTPASASTMKNPLFESEDTTASKTEGGESLSVEKINKAQKLIKWAGSALDYDDVPTSIMNLQKALHLLTTGQELE